MLSTGASQRRCMGGGAHRAKCLRRFLPRWDSGCVGHAWKRHWHLLLPLSSAWRHLEQGRERPGWQCSSTRGGTGKPTEFCPFLAQLTVGVRSLLQLTPYQQWGGNGRSGEEAVRREKQGGDSLEQKSEAWERGEVGKGPEVTCKVVTHLHTFKLCPHPPLSRITCHLCCRGQ